ncbi:MAG: lipopolysaccharide biosynthesis protein [Flavobacteriales bacterium]|nr:lipopolysaccharide biosynthesis protein [Flavobacteriales bacterium]MDG1781282.1 lipopolysaccharide biosynthesis protein [Flavobacteriales bacterium]
MTLRDKFIRSFGWQALNVFSQVLLQLAFISILARLISKEAFGVMAIALVVVGFIEIFSQIGIGPALIQRKELTQENINGAFFISVFLGLVFTIGLYVIAPWIADYYDHQPLTKVLRWIGLSFIISALAIVPRSLIIKEMSFKKLFFCSITAMTIGNLGVGLTLAYLGYDLWAYVFALLSQNVLMTVSYWYFHPVKITFTWNWATTADMIRYGGGSTLFNVFNYAATKIDTLIVGKLANAPEFLDTPNAELNGQVVEPESSFIPSSATELSIAEKSWSTTGIYDRSVYLMSLPITVLGKLSDSVMFSGLSQLQDDLPKLQRAFLSAVYHIGLLVIPGAIFMVFFAEEITILFLGDKFYDSVPIVSILFISVAFRSLIKISDSVVRALDKVYTASAIKAMFFVLVALGTYFGWDFGLKGVAWGLVIAVFVQFIMMKAFTLKLVKLNWSKLIKKLIPGVIAGMLVALISIPSQWINTFLADYLLLRLMIALALNGVLLLVVAWFVPFIFRQGKDNVLASIAEKLPISSLRKRWGSKS